MINVRTFVAVWLLGGACVAMAAEPPARAAPIGAPPEQRTAAEVFLRDQRVLLAPREVALDIGVFLTRREELALAEVNGGAALLNAESQNSTIQLIGRYSLSNTTELFAGTSIGDQRAGLFAGPDRVSRASRREAGDVGVGVRHMLLRENLGRPDIIGSLDLRIPTGDTSYAVGTGVTLVKSLDPVVVFGTLAYRHTFSREFADVTRAEPRNRVELALGYAFAVNDTLSLNTSYVSSFTGASRTAQTALRSSTASALQLGMTARIARGIYLQPSLTFQLNGPGSGYTLGINVPLTF